MRSLIYFTQQTYSRLGASRQNGDRESIRSMGFPLPPNGLVKGDYAPAGERLRIGKAAYRKWEDCKRKGIPYTWSDDEMEKYEAKWALMDYVKMLPLMVSDQNRGDLLGVEDKQTIEKLVAETTVRPAPSSQGELFANGQKSKHLPWIAVVAGAHSGRQEGGFRSQEGGADGGLLRDHDEALRREGG